MDQYNEIENINAAQIAQELGLSLRALHYWKSVVRECIPEEIAKIFIENPETKVISPFELSVIRQARAYLKVQKISREAAVKRALEEWLQSRENLHVQYQSEIHKLKTKLTEMHALVEKQTQQLERQTQQLDRLQQWSETSDHKLDTLDRNLDHIFEGFNRLIGVLERRNFLSPSTDDS